MAKSLEESTGYFKTAFFMLIVAVVLQAVGFATPNWFVLSLAGLLGSRTGLWQTCGELAGFVACEESAFKGEGWFIAVQVLEAVGLGFLVISLIISLALLLSVTSKWLSKANINVCSFGGSLIGVGLTVFAIKTMTSSYPEVDVGLGYSYWLSLGSIFALFVVVALLVCDKRQSSNA